MHYLGVAAGPEFHHVCRLEEVLEDEPPVRLRATFYEPGSAAAVVEEVRALDQAVVAVSAPRSAPAGGRSVRACDAALARRGVAPQPLHEAGVALFEALAERSVYQPSATGALPAGEEDEAVVEGAVEDGAYVHSPVFEVNVDAVFCALLGHRVPARRHPLGVLVRIQELLDDRVEDAGGDLWHRRIEEVEAAASALAAHRYAVGHACWIGDPEEGVVVLPGSRVPEAFPAEGVLPPVARARLGSGGRVTRA